MRQVYVKSSGHGQRETWGWDYSNEHAPSRDGRAMSYWAKVATRQWPSDGVAIIIRVAA